MTLEYHPKYIARLAKVYLEKHEAFGYDAAVLWWMSFIPDDLKPPVHEQIVALTSQQKGDTNK